MVDEEYIPFMRPVKLENGEWMSPVDVINNYNRLYAENEELRISNKRYSDWIASIKREDVDRVVHMSVYEILELLEYYRGEMNSLREKNEKLRSLLGV